MQSLHRCNLWLATIHQRGVEWCREQGWDFYEDDQKDDEDDEDEQRDDEDDEDDERDDDDDEVDDNEDDEWDSS